MGYQYLASVACWSSTHRTTRCAPSIPERCKWRHIDGLVQERRNPSAIAMGLRLSCINPMISWELFQHYWSFIRVIHRIPHTTGKLCGALTIALCYKPEKLLSDWSSSWWFVSPWYSCDVIQIQGVFQKFAFYLKLDIWLASLVWPANF